MRRAVRYCRERQGPSLIHAKVIRPYSHSLSDDERLYRSTEERTADAELGQKVANLQQVNVQLEQRLRASIEEAKAAKEAESSRSVVVSQSQKELDASRAQIAKLEADLKASKVADADFVFAVRERLEEANGVRDG